MASLCNAYEQMINLIRKELVKIIRWRENSQGILGLNSGLIEQFWIPVQLQLSRNQNWLCVKLLGYNL